MITQVARMITRPGGTDTDKGMERLLEFNPSTPDLIMATIMKSGAHHLKSNCVYELVFNELSDTLELREIGEANIGKRWGKAYYDLPMDLGPTMWLTKEEYAEHVKQYEEEHSE